MITLKICEVCNHNRSIDDVGTVQIPEKIKQFFGEGKIKVEHSFGGEYQTKNLQEYDLIIHCGGCMIDQQKMMARMSDMRQAGVPITNYGLLLSYLTSKEALSKVVQPWTMSVNII